MTVMTTTYSTQNGSQGPSLRDSGHTVWAAATRAAEKLGGEHARRHWLAMPIIWYSCKYIMYGTSEALAKQR